jgi:hypothetical protein
MRRLAAMMVLLLFGVLMIPLHTSTDTLSYYMDTEITATTTTILPSDATAGATGLDQMLTHAYFDSGGDTNLAGLVNFSTFNQLRQKGSGEHVGVHPLSANALWTLSYCLETNLLTGATTTATTNTAALPDSGTCTFNWHPMRC